MVKGASYIYSLTFVSQIVSGRLYPTALCTIYTSIHAAPTPSATLLVCRTRCSPSSSADLWSATSSYHRRISTRSFCMTPPGTWRRHVSLLHVYHLRSAVTVASQLPALSLSYPSAPCNTLTLTPSLQSRGTRWLSNFLAISVPLTPFSTVPPSFPTRRSRSH